MIAKYPGTCKCGRPFSPGEEVTWDPETRKIVGCPGCEQTGRTICDMGPGMKDPDSNLAKRLERKRIQRQKNLKRWDTGSPEQ